MGIIQIFGSTLFSLTLSCMGAALLSKIWKEKINNGKHNRKQG